LERIRGSINSGAHLARTIFRTHTSANYEAFIKTTARYLSGLAEQV
jgi:hypothetical protein